MKTMFFSPVSISKRKTSAMGYRIELLALVRTQTMYSYVWGLFCGGGVMETSKNKGIITALNTSGDKQKREKEHGSKTVVVGKRGVMSAQKRQKIVNRMEISFHRNRRSVIIINFDAAISASPLLVWL